LLAAAEDGEIDIAGEKRRRTLELLDALDALTVTVKLEFTGASGDLQLIVDLLGEFHMRVCAGKVVDVLGTKHFFANGTGCQSVNVVARAVLVAVVAESNSHCELGWWLDARMLGSTVSLEGLKGAVDISTARLHVAAEVRTQGHVEVDIDFFKGIVFKHFVVHVERMTLRLGSHLLLWMQMRKYKEGERCWKQFTSMTVESSEAKWPQPNQKKKTVEFLQKHSNGIIGQTSIEY
jgi:hypothetical protein